MQWYIRLVNKEGRIETHTVRENDEGEIDYIDEKPCFLYWNSDVPTPDMIYDCLSLFAQGVLNYEDYKDKELF